MVQSAPGTPPAIDPKRLIAYWEHWKRRVHTMSLERWAAKLLLLRPGAYAELPPAERPTATLPGSRGRMAVYRRRASNKRKDGTPKPRQAIFHAGDLEATSKRLSERLRKKPTISAGNNKVVGGVLMLEGDGNVRLPGPGPADARPGHAPGR